MHSSRRRRVALAVGLAVLIASAVVLIVRPGGRPGPVRPPGPPVNVPHAIVALGDSTMSGEGIGDYLAGTNGSGGDWCHRSRRAEVMRTTVPGVAKKINLACSGASSDGITFGGKPHYTEQSQAARLTPIARRYRVTAVVVAVGANDDPDFANTMTGCIDDYLRQTDCTGGDFGQRWRDRVQRMQPKVTAALADIRTAMHRAHYDDSDYQLVLQSYASPVGPDVAPGLQNLSGCPFRTADLRWFRDTGVRVLDNALGEVAAAAGARFLNLARAGVGHEACSGGQDASSEWFSRLTVDWHDLLKDNRAPHALQGSFHPNARGYRQFARCLTEFLGTTARRAACLPGADGTLHAATSVPAR